MGFWICHRRVDRKNRNQVQKRCDLRLKEENLEKSGKNFEKPLDKRGRMWYTIGAAREQPASRSEAREKARFRRNGAKKT